MTQLYVGNLSAEGDEKAIRALFGKYGAVREVLMKNGYAFVEFDNQLAAEDAMRELNGEPLTRDVSFRPYGGLAWGYEAISNPCTAYLIT